MLLGGFVSFKSSLPQLCICNKYENFLTPLAACIVLIVFLPFFPASNSHCTVFMYCCFSALLPFFPSCWFCLISWIDLFHLFLAIMAGDYKDNFPGLDASNPLSGSVRAAFLSSPKSKVSQKIDIMEMLERSSAPNFEHLKIDATEGPAAKQIKELNAELIKLKWLLEEKEKMLNLAKSASSPTGISHGPGVPNVSWKDKVVSEESVAPHMNLQFFSPIVSNGQIMVSPPEDVANLGVAKWKDCLVGYFVDQQLPFMAVKTIALKIWGKFGLLLMLLRLGLGTLEGD